MDIQEFLTDTIVDVISEKDIAAENCKKENFKKGFFLENSYSLNRTVLKDKKMLVTEKYLVTMIKQGKKNIRIPENSIITPSARMLIEEGKILIKG